MSWNTDSRRNIIKKVTVLMTLGVFVHAANASDINISKKFNPDTRKELEATTVELTLTNENLNFDALNASVTDTLPTGMTVATPLNVVTSNCGASVNVTAPTTNQVTITGAQINKFTSTPTPCIVRFDVIAPKLAAGASQENYINDILVGELTADIDGSSIINETSATATLTVKKNEVEVAHGFYLDGVSTEMNTGLYFNEGEDLYLVTTITNPSFVQLTGVNFTNDFANSVVNGIPGSATTTCGGTVLLNKSTPSTTRDQMTLTGGTIPPNGSCEVRVKIDRTTSEFQYRNLNTYDTVVAGAVSTDEGFTNRNTDSASVRVIGGPRIYKSFCTSTGSGCVQSLTVPTILGTDERYVRLQLVNNNTNGSPFRSVFTDQLPAGMTLAPDPDISITPTATCAAVTATGAAGSSSITIDATNMPPASVTNSILQQNSQCFINAKVIFDASTDGTEYQNTLFAGNNPAGNPVTSPVNSYDWTINGGHTDDTNGGFSPYVHTSELIIEEPEDLSIRKDFNTRDVRAGHEFTMTLTLTNDSANPITNVNIADDLKTMSYSTYEPVIFSQGESRTTTATTTCPAGNLGGLSGVGDYNTGDQQLNFTGLTVPANGSCIVTVPLIIDSSFPIRPSNYVVMRNTIQGNDVSYTSGGVTSTLNDDVSNYIRTRARYYRSKVFTPDEIKAGGSSRINIRVYIYGGAVSDLVNLIINDDLPAGMTLADNPDASFTCDRVAPVGVTLNATAGGSTLGVTVGSIPKTASNVNNNCYLRATVKTDASYTSSTMTNTATVTAQEGVGPLQDAAGEVIESHYGPLTDTIKVDSLAQLAVNKTVSIEDVGVGGSVRAIITMDNTLPNAIDLTGVTLTDDLRVSGSSELLVVDPANATFGEDSTGTQTTCTGGTFSVNAGRTAITLSDANIPAGSVCVFAFDMTSQTGGTWTNAVPAESLSSFEGITNPSATQKAVSFSGNLVIGSKKSVTSFVNNGNGTYTVSYELGVKNFSVFPLQEVEVIDNLSGEFGTVGTDYTVSTAPSISSATTGASLTLNAAYDGGSTSQLASGGVLPVDGEVVVAFAVTFTPRKGQFSFDNAARVSGESAGGLVTTDFSNDGDYLSGTNDNPAADNTPTTVDVPQIGVTKSAATITNNNNGTFTADYTVKVKNYGGVVLDNVVLTDSLATEFSGTDYSVTTAPTITSGTGLTLTAGYNGDAQSELATGSLALNAEVTITFSVTFTPVANKTTYNNQASATGVSRDDPSFSTSDQSNDKDYEDTSSTSTTDNGDPTDDNVPTPVVVNPKTLLGLAKAAGVAMAETDANGVPTGNFTTNITIIAQNMGDEDLINVAITDSLINNAATGTGFGTVAVTGSPSNAGEFVVSNVSVANGTGANFALTAGYNGASQSEIATATMLPRASQATFTFTITWRPESGKTQYTNQTSGTSTGEVTGNTAEDDSDNGTTPDGDGNGDPTNDSDPTPTTITTTPRIGIAKSATALTPVGSSGAFTTTMTLTVKNYGNEALKDVTVTDALDNATTGFGVYVADVASVTSAGQYTVTTQLPVSSPLTLNPSYTGSGSNTQLISSGTLAIGEMTTVTLTITFMPDLTNNRYDYENTAVAAAKGDVSDNDTADDSVDGTNPDSNGDNNPDEQSPTKVSVTPEPVIGIAKQASTVDNNDGTFTTTMALVIENLGNETLNDVNIIDNLSTEFGTYVATPADLIAAGQYTVSNISATGLTAETTFTGTGTTETVATGTLVIAATANIAFDVTYNPAKINYVNQATASAMGNVSMNPTTDNSDNGTNVDADGDGDPTESGEDDPTPISITPQPVIGSAKTAGTVTDNGDGTFSVPYTVLVENIGNENLTDVVLADDLTTAFGTNDSSVSADGSYNVADFAASGDTTNVVINTTYTGATGNDNLINSGRLAVGESVTISFTVTFRPANNTETEFDNQVTANAEGNASGTVTTDLSNDGGVIDTDGNGIANENVGTGDDGDNKITTININRLPEAVDDTYTTGINTSVTLTPLTGDNDPEGGTLTIVSINGTDLTPGTAQTIVVPNGTVNVSATGEISFSPNAGFTGSVTFPYVIEDDKGATASANEIITITSSPVAVDDTYTVESGSSVTLAPLTGDSDADGDTLSIVSINGTDLTPGTAQTITVPNGTVNVSATGEISFTPNAGFTGSVTFPYVITDGKDTATANEIITVNDKPNTKPTAVDDNYIVDSGKTVALNPINGDSDPEGDTLTVVSINGTDLIPGTAQTITVPNGTVNVSATGEISFTPNAGFTGSVTFPYVITDGKDTATANEIITVNGRTNNPPLAADDNYSTVSSDSAVTLNPLDGDSDPDGDTLSIVSINGVDLTPGTPQTIPVPNGTVSVSATGVITFTPNAGFTGYVTFPYVITDGNQTATANEIIRVTPVKRPTQPVPSTSLWSLLALLLSLVWISFRRNVVR